MDTHMTCCSSLIDAVHYRHFDCVCHLHNTYGLHNYNIAYKNAIESNDLVMVSFLHEHGCTLDASARFHAARYGCIDILTYLHTQCSPSNLPSECEQAIICGSLECLQFIHQTCGYVLEETGAYSLCELASISGNLACLKYLHEHGCPWDHTPYKHAARRGHFECVRYLNEHGCPWNANASEAAAFGGHLRILQYLRVQGCPWDDNATIAASSQGHIECLRYLHENGCPMESHVCISVAADNGRIDCLTYLHEECGCALSEYALIIAANLSRRTWGRSPGAYACFRYLLEKGCPWRKSNFKQDAGEYNIVRSPLTKLSMDQDYDYLSSKLKNETWFQLCMLKNGEVNEYNFHILHKVRCIQKAWLCYSFNPNKQIGFNRMIRTIQLTQSIDNLPFTI